MSDQTSCGCDGAITCILHTPMVAEPAADAAASLAPVNAPLEAAWGDDDVPAPQADLYNHDVWHGA
ncbi:hypothetical protein SDRG_01473 [Saprolegnia diclina VS20]|uniref:Uncharacterized protein n=1 Tax=Saprolegnia diclina (strain VS20) TaxID=1156394 RepID=T0R3I6_SAPDV|nr:hypothetical protein SDRG_01473 [Saprolegnia diclina VS20]EQC41506.1 hypothetical protein SDRG_01473 [Saprolegnia diclina VS20]|eukprot:XP_008605220.1 hypothetical protein SDRG_01473 [Saprolegnia diclina VS20]